jgi:hypothetical protein
MAIKPIAKEFVPFVDELLSLGLLDPKMAHSGRAVENAMKTHTDLMRKPFYRNMVNEGRQSGFASNINRVDVDRPTVDPESLLGKAIVNYRSDRSDLGLMDMLTGTPMNVDVQSGTKFTPTNIDQGRGWASMGKLEGLGTAQKAHRQAQDLADAGYEPVANSIIMGEPSSRFSTPVSEAMLAKIQSMNMPKGLLDEFDKEMRKVKPDWVGVRSEDARSQLVGQGGFSMDGAGAERHRFLQVLEMPKFRDAGLPQPNTALPVIDNPEYAGMEYGTSGLNMWLPDTKRSTELVTGLHNTYSHSMPAKEMVGQFETPVSFAAMNPKAYRELGLELTNPKNGGTPKPYSDMQKVNANMDRRIGNRGTIQPTDQEWLDSVSTAIEKNKGLVAKYGSIPAALSAGEVLADPMSDLRASEAQWDMTPEERAIADLRASEEGFVPASNPKWESVPMEGLASTLGALKGNKNYQNFENIAPFGTGLVDYGYNVATGSEQGLLDYIFAGGDLAVLPAPLKKAAKGLIGMFK